MKYVFIKLFIGLVLFGTLVALTVLDIPNSARLVDLCYAGLVGLGIMHLGGDQSSADGAPRDKQGGFISVNMMAALFVSGGLLFIGACSPFKLENTQDAQVRYTQSCIAYGAAFGVALDLRKAGKLNDAQLEQVSMIESQITPICTGPLPPDPTSATVRVTSAIAALSILETSKP